ASERGEFQASVRLRFRGTCSVHPGIVRVRWAWGMIWGKPSNEERCRMSRSVRTRPEGSGQALAEAYDTALLDLDGVVYAGGNAIAYAVESLATARRGGMRLAYVTNNALRTPDTVAAHLTELGIPTGADEVITSAQAVARLISEQVPAGARILVVGGEGLRVALRGRGLEPVESVRGGELRRRPGAAVVRVQHGPDDPQRPGHRAGQRRGGGGRPDRHRGRTAGGGQAAAAHAPRDDPADRGRAAAGGGGPPGHGHRGGVQRRGRLAAGADRSDGRRAAAGRAAAAPADVRGRRPARPADGPAGGRRGGGGLPVRRLDGDGGRRPAGTGRGRRRPGRAARLVRGG